MFLVLVLHANFLGVGAPSPVECSITPINSFLRFFLASLSIAAIDVFVLISGWFGIKPTVRKLLSLFFQIIFFTVTILIVFAIIKGREVIGLKPILKLFMLTKGYWFIKSYICLYILSPVLNLFAEKASKKTFSLVLISFFVFQTIYGWTDSAPEFYYGYSTLSFIGLYMMARYFRLYPIPLQSNRKLCLATYFIISFLLAISIWFLFRIEFHIDYAPKIVFSYINPLVILSSLALFFIFENTPIPYSKTINWIASSSFAVFIIHTNDNIMYYYRSIVWYLYSNFTVCLRVLLILVFLVLIFLLCVLLDKVRLFVWHKVEKAFDRHSTRMIDG